MKDITTIGSGTGPKTYRNLEATLGASTIVDA